MKEMKLSLLTGLLLLSAATAGAQQFEVPVSEAQEKMMTASQGVFTKMYEGMQGAAGAAGAGPAPDMSGAAGAGSTGSSSGDGGNNDDIIDGDFKEI